MGPLRPTAVRGGRVLAGSTPGLSCAPFRRRFPLSQHAALSARPARGIGQVEVLSERSSCSCGSGMCSWPLPVSACPLEHAMREIGDGRGGGDGQDESAACSLFPVSLGLAYEQWLKGLAGHAGRRSSSARHRRRPWGTHGLFCGRALPGPPYKRGPWHFRLSIALVRLLSLFSPPSTGFLLVGGHTSLCNPPSYPGR